MITTTQPFSEASINLVIRKISNSTCHFHYLNGNSTIILSTVQPFSVLLAVDPQLPKLGVMFICRMVSLITCIQFRLFIKQYLTNWNKFCI